jgi:hypothetical protein
MDKLKTLPLARISKLLYRIYKFNINNTPSIYLLHHGLALNEESISSDTKLVFQAPAAHLTLKADKFVCAIEGVHFILNILGEIEWL